MTNNLLMLAVLLISNNLFAGHDHSNHDSHGLNHLAPIGIMSDHMHTKGTLMMSYRHMSMEMNGIISGAKDISKNDYFSDTNYMMAPSKMNKTMHMLGAMYALTDKFSIMAMIPQISNVMTMVKKMGRTEVESESKSIGDIRVTSLIKFVEKENSSFIMGIGITLPTGQINHKKDGANLPYGMQTGSGSYALNIISTFTKRISHWSFGAQLDAKSYLNENTNDYKKGNEYLTNIWLQRSFAYGFDSSLRISQKNIDPLESTESSISMMSSTFSPSAQHGMRRLAYLGLSYSGFKGNRISMEIGKPIAQDLASYQLKSESMFTLGLQKLF